MKKRDRILLCLIIMISSSLALFSEESSLEFEKIDNTYVFDFNLGDFTYDPTIIEGTEFTDLNINGQPKTFDKGFPALPFFSYSLIIPVESDAFEIEIIAETLTKENLIPLPSKGIISRTIDPATVAWEFSKVYSENLTYPNNNIEVSNPYILRDFKGITIKVIPFAYNGENQILSIRKNIKFKLTYSSPNPQENLRTSIPKDFSSLYENHFINYNETRYTSVEETGRMIVITYPNYAEYVQPLVDWKNSKGLETDLYTLDETGTTTTAIKNFIQDQYDADDGLAYVLLVGDINRIPSFTSSIYHSGLSDPMYTQLAGDDYYPEIFIGRFSAENSSQVTTQVEKTIFYERDITAVDWPGKGVGIASQQGTGDDGEYDYEHIRNIRTDLMGYTYTLVDELYEGNQGGEDESSWPTTSDVAASFNAGKGIATYCGHGSAYSWGTSSFSTSHVNNLTNDYMLPFIISVACVNGEFDSNSPCFAETWLRATHNGNPTGAIAFYGSSVNQLWNPPMSAQDEAIDLLVGDEKQTFAGICFNGSCLMMDEYGVYYGADTFNTWHIFGDPSLMLRTMTPQSFTLTNPVTITPEDTELIVETSVANVDICIVDNLYNILFNGNTGSTGSIQVDLTDFPNTEQSLLITATKFNYLTVLDNIDIDVETGIIDTPENVVVSLNSTAIILSWNPVPEANSYNIYFSLYPDHGFNLLETVSATTQSREYPLDQQRGFYRVMASDQPF